MAEVNGLAADSREDTEALDVVIREWTGTRLADEGCLIELIPISSTIVRGVLVRPQV
jgi:hypothetical protein